MKFSEEIISEAILEEAKPLFAKHWEEIAHYKDIPLDPDYALYLKVQATGMIRAYSARTEDGTLIGYAIYFLKNHFHYKQTLYAQQDVLFFDPEQRGKGMLFLMWCDEQLKKLGVKVVSHHVKVAHDFSHALERIGYEKQDIILTKRLDK
jgi:hypothetical protein